MFARVMRASSGWPSVRSATRITAERARGFSGRARRPRCAAPDATGSSRAIARSRGATAWRTTP